MKKLKIAVISAIDLPTPPSHNTIFAPIVLASQLTEGLKKLGHDVTLFASSGSKTTAKLKTWDTKPFLKNSIIKNIQSQQTAFYKHNKKTYKDIELFSAIEDSVALSKDASQLYQCEQNYFLSKSLKYIKDNKFDVVHIMHAEEGILPYTNIFDIPIVITLHNETKFPRSYHFKKYLKNKNLHFVSISNSQRKSFPQLNYIDTVYNGINVDTFSVNKKSGKYLFTAGRILPKKGFHTAIAVAKKTGLPLKITGMKNQNAVSDDSYWSKSIKPELKGNIEYFGLLSPKQIHNLFKNAKAFLFPITWREPFGLVMIEAMASGTPVIAFNNGSVPEVIKNGKTGFIVKNESEMIKAVEKIDFIDRNECRKHVENNFTLAHMISGYEKVYYKLAK